MSWRRRRANDFTNSLNSFQHTEFESDTLYSISQDSLDEIKSKNNPNCNAIMHSSKYSTILAGSSAKDSLIQNSSISSVTSSEIHCAPDLNERIDLFHVEDSCVISKDDKENNNPQYSLKDKKGMENNDLLKKLSSTSKKQILVSHNKLESNAVNEMSNRDSNYNIHDKKPNVILNLESSAPKATLKFDISPISTNRDKIVLGTTPQKECIHNEPKKFEIILCSLDNQLNQLKEVSQSEKIFKRLSEQFLHAPRNFTEKLLTIIEETVINNDDEETCNASAVTLSRLTTEFKKMCKFIEDESAPEWPVSPLATPPCQVQVDRSPASNKSMKASKNVSYNSPTSTSVSTTPISGIDILRRRFLNKISKTNPNGSIDSVINKSSNISFERLEAQCKRLFPEEEEYSKCLRRSLSMPSLLSMSHIQHICEKQMAALNVSNVDENDKKSTTLSTPNLLRAHIFQSPPLNKSDLNGSKLKGLHNDLKNTQYDNTLYSMRKSKEGNEKTDCNKMTPDDFLNSHVTLDPDELEKTLLQDIAVKRKRCLDTVRLITEINADPEAIEAHKTLKMSPLFADDNESNSLTHDETRFLKTLMSCKDYQIYLEKRKPLFELLQNSNPCTPETSLKDTKQSDTKCENLQHLEKKVLNEKRTPNTKSAKSSPNVLSRNLYKTPLLKSSEKKEKAAGTKPKLFVTPGKTPPSKNNWKKKEYFPTMNNPVKSTMERHILKSPHAEGLYRLNYTTIMSPVGMYIRGTDMQLLKNVRPKTDKLLLTPLKNNTKASPMRNSQQNTPSRSITRTQGKAPLKLNLSPKIDANCAYTQEALRRKSLEGDSTPKSHFILPKVSYKLPLQVKTIKENKSLKQGNRMKKLLEATQSKVVIRHEGRVNSVQKEKNTVNGEIYEINYAPENESIHVEQTASKTNFVHGRRNM